MPEKFQDWGHRTEEICCEKCTVYNLQLFSLEVISLESNSLSHSVCQVSMHFWNNSSAILRFDSVVTPPLMAFASHDDLELGEKEKVTGSQVR